MSSAVQTMDADLAGASALDQSTLQNHALDELCKALRHHGLDCRPHFETPTDPSLWVDCRPSHAAADHDLVYAVLERHRWRPDVIRHQASVGRYDVTRVHHKPSGAALCLIIKIPAGE